MAWTDKKGKPCPAILKEKRFEKQLRDRLLQSRGYAKHYVGSSVKVAYSIPKP